MDAKRLAEIEAQVNSTISVPGGEKETYLRRGDILALIHEAKQSVWRAAENEDLRVRLKDALAEKECYHEALKDIEHGPVGYWCEDRYAPLVVRNMMQTARKALKGGE